MSVLVVPQQSWLAASAWPQAQPLLEVRSDGNLAEGIVARALVHDDTATVQTRAKELIEGDADVLYLSTRTIEMLKRNKKKAMNATGRMWQQLQQLAGMPPPGFPSVATAG